MNGITMCTPNEDWLSTLIVQDFEVAIKLISLLHRFENED